MARINTRSPKWFYIEDSDLDSATLKLYIWNDTKTSVPTNPTYTITKKALPSSQPIVWFEVAELVRDELDTIFDGDYTGQAVWVKAVMIGYDSGGSEIVTETPNTVIAFDCYNNFEEQNADESALMITNRE